MNLEQIRALPVGAIVKIRSNTDENSTYEKQEHHEDDKEGWSRWIAAGHGFLWDIDIDVCFNGDPEKTGHPRDSCKLVSVPTLEGAPPGRYLLELKGGNRRWSLCTDDLGEWRPTEPTCSHENPDERCWKCAEGTYENVNDCPDGRYWVHWHPGVLELRGPQRRWVGGDCDSPWEPVAMVGPDGPFFYLGPLEEIVPVRGIPTLTEEQLGALSFGSLVVTDNAGSFIKCQHDHRGEAWYFCRADDGECLTGGFLTQGQLVKYAPRFASTLPTPDVDHGLIDCPACGAGACVPEGAGTCSECKDDEPAEQRAWRALLPRVEPEARFNVREEPPAPDSYRARLAEATAVSSASDDSHAAPGATVGDRCGAAATAQRVALGDQWQPIQPGPMAPFLVEPEEAGQAAKAASLKGSWGGDI